MMRLGDLIICLLAVSLNDSPNFKGGVNNGGRSIVKREILACLGLNLTLMDRKLSIRLKPPLNVFTMFAPEVQALHSRLESHESQSGQGAMEALYAENEIWGE